MALCVIFPAFVNEYTGMEQQAISKFNNSFYSLLEIAADFLKLDLANFHFQENNFLDDELKSQYISYIFSCSVADILRGKKIKPEFVSGYSMGIYAACYYCETFSFKDGLLLVKNAWEKISHASIGNNYGMGMIVGLKASEISALKKSYNGIEICNQNNQHTFIISGLYDELVHMLKDAREEGALRSVALQVKSPYHSKFIKPAIAGFTDIVNQLTFLNPGYKYISAIDGKMINNADMMKNEVITNICCRMNWFETMKTIISLGVDNIFECGGGDGLTRNFRFIDGDYKSFSINKLDKFLELATMYATK